MKLLAGLGNPGPRYVDSRHNVGFMVVDELARRWRIDVTRYDRDFEAQVGDGPIAGLRTLLLKPLTYMNLSGRSVSAAWRFYKIAPADVLVVIDDLDLPVGKLRLRADGSAGGHKGLADVLRHLGHEQLPRLRVGIGTVHRSATVEHVLGPFDRDEQPLVVAGIAAAADACELWLREGLVAAMNAFNRRSRDQQS